MMKKSIITLIVLAIAAPVMANRSVTLDFNHTVFGTGVKTIHFRSTNTTESYGRDYAGTAGMYDAFINGERSNIFCIDLRQNATTRAVTYEIAPLKDAPRPYDGNPDNDLYAMNAKKAHAIKELWSENINKVNDKITGAAFQLAVWEIVHEEKDAAYDLYAGNGFWATNGYQMGSSSYARFAASLETAQGWLNELNGRYDADPISLRAYVSDRYQCFVGEGAVPAPGALVLGSLGTLFVGWVRQRKNLR